MAQKTKGKGGGIAKKRPHGETLSISPCLADENDDFDAGGYSTCNDFENSADSSWHAPGGAASASPRLPPAPKAPTPAGGRDRSDSTGLPPQWEEINDPHQPRPYFYNKVTGESVWHAPGGAASASPRLPPRPPAEFRPSGGREYYDEAWRSSACVPPPSVAFANSSDRGFDSDGQSKFSVPPFEVPIPEGLLSYKWTYHQPPGQVPYYFNSYTGQSQQRPPTRRKSTSRSTSNHSSRHNSFDGSNQVNTNRSSRSNSYDDVDGPEPPAMSSGSELMSYRLEMARIQATSKQSDAILKSEL